MNTENPTNEPTVPQEPELAAAAQGVRASAWPAAAVLAVLLVIATVAAYWRVGQNEFVRYDDHEYIIQNNHVMKGLTWDDVRWAFTEYHSANWHPLTWISHMVDVELFGKWAGGHHLVSLAIHILSALVLMTLLLYTTGKPWPSALVAGLFALHPVHVESVAWAAERKDVLCAFFWFASMLAYAFYARKPGIGRYAAVLGLFVLGLLSKPMIVTLPFVLLLFDYWPLERFEIEREGWRFRIKGASVTRLVLEKLPLCLLVVASCLVTLQAQAAAIAKQESLGFGTRLANATTSYGRYVWAMVWPVDLAVFYPLGTRLMYLKLAFSVLMLVFVSVVAVRLARSQRHILVGWLWYLVTLVPVIGLVQVGSQSHADRYTYVPLVGLFVALVWTVMAAMAKKPDLQRKTIVAGVVVLMVLGVLTYRQTGFWKDDLSLFTRAVVVTKQNPEMLANVGVVIGERGGTEDGLRILKEALSQKPNSERIMASIASLLLDADRPQDANEYYIKALKLRLDNWESQLGMARVQSKLNNLAAAEAYCRRAIELDPETPDSYNILGIIFVQMNRVDDAVAAFKQAAEKYPGVASARLNIARIYALQGRRNEAIEECRKSIAMLPHPMAYGFLVELLEEAGKPAEAEAACREGIAKLPDDASLYDSLGTLLAKQGRKAEAASLVRRAAEIEPENAVFRDYLKRIEGNEPLQKK